MKNSYSGKLISIPDLATLCKITWFSNDHAYNSFACIYGIEFVHLCIQIGELYIKIHVVCMHELLSHIMNWLV